MASASCSVHLSPAGPASSGSAFSYGMSSPPAARQQYRSLAASSGSADRPASFIRTPVMFSNITTALTVSRGFILP